MPSDWHWWAGIVGEWNYEVAVEQPTRQAAIEEALRNTDEGDVVQIIEARISTAAKYDGWDAIPFTHTRNHEIIGTRTSQGFEVAT
ncbi:MAG: hypothetical protein AB7E60_11520 [Sphingobium sp.]